MNRLALIILLLTGAILAAVWSLWNHDQNSTMREQKQEIREERLRPSSHLARPPAYSAELANLGTLPDWSKLKAYAQTRTAGEIRQEIENIYSVSDIWQDYLEITPSHLIAKTGKGKIKIPLAKSETEKRPAPRFWRSGPDKNATPDQPLLGRVIAIDPGHIGGTFARIEERWFAIGNSLPVAEGSMTLKVARHLKKKLEALGASVVLILEKEEPVTAYRPRDFAEFVSQRWDVGDSAPLTKKYRELLFYRTAEIRSRAALINELYQPDLLVCLHFNAMSWGDPTSPSLAENEHFHTLVNGAYTDGEWEHQDERFEMLTRLFQGTHKVERDISLSIIEAFVKATELPAYQYLPGSSRARKVHPTNNYLWARNLLANRIYRCPVIFLEPYVMNSRDTFLRVQAGDYTGLRKINGRIRPSLYKEYAQAVADGLRKAYTRQTPATLPSS